MEHWFDDVARTVAGGISRREALRRLGGGLTGAFLVSLVPGHVSAQARVAAEPSIRQTASCRAFCESLFPGPGRQRQRRRAHCIEQASRNRGPCYQCGPQAPSGDNRKLCGTPSDQFCQVCSSGSVACCAGYEDEEVTQAEAICCPPGSTCCVVETRDRTDARCCPSGTTCQNGNCVAG